MPDPTTDPRAAWPTLPYEPWVDTRRTIHRYAQVVGKVRMALAPPRNHWWHVTLHVATRGLTTGPVPTGDGRTLEVRFDVLAHALVATTSDGGEERFDLVDGLACEDFYAALFRALRRLGVGVAISPAPFDIGGPLLSRDREHDAYDADAVVRWWTALRSSAAVLDEFAGWFNGKQSPVHLFWHSFDLAMARFSGRRAPARPGADPVTAEAYSHEVIAFGFWPGDDATPFPAYYSYTAPAPEGLTAGPLRPPGAWWSEAAGTAYLRYDDVRASPSPRATLLEFLASAYDAGAAAAGWDAADLATAFDPGRAPVG